MGDINNRNDGGVSIKPDPAGSPNSGFKLDDENPDYLVEINMKDRKTVITLAEGEPMALNAPDGSVFATLSVSEYEGD